MRRSEHDILPNDLLEITALKIKQTCVIFTARHLITGMRLLWIPWATPIRLALLGV